MNGYTYIATLEELKQLDEKEKVALCNPPKPQPATKPTTDGNAPAKPPNKLKIKQASDFEAKRQNYLLYPYFLTGTFSIIAGDAGSTKTWFSLYIAKLITTAESFITDTPFDKREQGYVIYQSKENNMETDVRPRLDILQANLNNFLVIDYKDEDGNGMPLTLTDGRIEQYKSKAIAPPIKY